jgi:putative endonuclease
MVSGWLARLQRALVDFKASLLVRQAATDAPSATSRKQRARRLGKHGEQAAATFLRRLGYRILAEGHLQRLGEIDLIALDGRCIVFVEVKTWSSSVEALPAEAVDLRKQEKLTRAALTFLKQHALLEQAVRFDVISIVWPASPEEQPAIRHFKHAFEAVGRFQMFR